MEAERLLTIDDLLAWSGDEHVELIDGAIVQRPMSRFEHAMTQSGLIRYAAGAGRSADIPWSATSTIP